MHRVEDLVKAIRPGPGLDFVGTPEGGRLLQSILDGPTPVRGRRRVSRRWKVGGAVALGVVFAGGATAAVGGFHAPTAPPEALPGSGSFMCATAGMHRMGDAVARDGESPVDACRRGWQRVFGEKAPQHLFPCVKQVEPARSPFGETESGAGWGALVLVVDGDQFGNAGETCGSIGMLVAPDPQPSPSVAG